MALTIRRAAVIVDILFVQAWKELGNVNLVPGLIMVGSFAVPLSALIFFVEVNARKNVSLYQVLRLLFVGGIISLILSLILFQASDAFDLNWLGASVAGLVEEPGMLAPFGHIVWTAMCGAALWRVKGDHIFQFEMVKDWRFLRIFITAVVMHMAWNSPYHLPFYGKFLIIGAVAWIIILGLIQDGLKQIREEKPAAVSALEGTWFRLDGPGIRS